MNDLDTLTVGRSVDSLLNYETVKYFGAEEREAARYRDVADQYARAAVKSENSLAWLNIGQSLVTNAAMAGAMRSEEHTSELQSLMRISYTVFFLKKKKQIQQRLTIKRDTFCTKSK